MTMERESERGREFVRNCCILAWMTNVEVANFIDLIDIDELEENNPTIISPLDAFLVYFRLSLVFAVDRPQSAEPTVFFFPPLNRWSAPWWFLIYFCSEYRTVPSVESPKEEKEGERERRMRGMTVTCCILWLVKRKREREEKEEKEEYIWLRRYFSKDSSDNCYNRFRLNESTYDSEKKRCSLWIVRASAAAAAAVEGAVEIVRKFHHNPLRLDWVWSESTSSVTR